MSRTTAILVGGLGRILIGAGVLILLFAAFQLWGTGLSEARAQDKLADEFRSQMAATAPPPTENVDVGAEPASTEVTLRRDQIPTGGMAVGQLNIPAIGVTKTFVEGTTRDILRAGPGHYGNTPLPGQPGNSAIAGHRTTHGAPFFDIDKLVPGDEIIVETLQGDFTYLVEGHENESGGQSGHFIVDPSEVGVISDKGDDRLTLTACHPKYSAAQRIIVTATLVGEPAPASLTPSELQPTDSEGAELATEDTGEPGNAPNTEPPDATADQGQELAAVDDTEPNATEDGGQELAVDTDLDGAVPGPAGTTGDSSVARSLGWQPAYAGPTAIWAAITAAIALVGWIVGRWWRRWPAYAIAFPPVALALFTCFTNLDKFIPAV